MDFGKWIVVAFVLFALFIGTLVAVCVRQDISLVSKEYYKEELAYQDQIVRIANTEKLTLKPKMTKVNKVTLQLTFSQQVEKGELKLFCPSNPKMDKTFSINSSENNIQLFNVETLQKGMYRAKLSWTMDKKEYFYEEVIFI
jgi:hypothetical protein